MELMAQSASDDAMLWLSQLGMQDPSLVKHFERLGSTKTDQFAATCDYPLNNNFELASSTFESMELKKSRKDHLSSVMYLDAYLNHANPAKTQVPHNQSVSQSFWQKYAVGALPGDDQKLQFQSEDIDTFGDFLPRLQDETYELIHPQSTPIFQGDMKGSPASVTQESVFSDVLSGGTLSSSNTINLFVTPGESRGAKRKSDQLLSDGTSFKSTTCSQTKPASGHSVDHIMAERKRREKLSQRFIALSAIIPGLKKMDKATVLGDAIKYLKQLQEKVKVLEDQTPKKVFRSTSSHSKELIPTENKGISQQQDATNPKHANITEDHEQFPEIDVRMVDGSVLIKVHCEKKKGIVVTILAELDKLHLLVSNAQILTFSKTQLNLTFMAQVSYLTVGLSWKYYQYF
ncbi:hypothetical protein O6H91_06G127500 [Diphasiastrum complanatum]|uniref:Uncharacterized protein n=1 Tax=Diphasiastrum complanatum TaxID=34168 RepID=A0ACC2DIM7_DIPCM|nr:hypothetical protein O6H91_06G127500 [Diphasiastrum complanatum]